MSQPLRALPRLTSEPFQEEIVVLRGQGGEHVLEVLPKLRGERRGTVSRAGDVAPSLPHPPGLKFVPRAGGRTGHSPLPSLAGDRPQASCQAQGVSKPVPLRKGTSNRPPPHLPSTKHPPSAISKKILGWSRTPATHHTPPLAPPRSAGTWGHRGGLGHTVPSRLAGARHKSPRPAPYQPCNKADRIIPACI